MANLCGPEPTPRRNVMLNLRNKLLDLAVLILASAILPTLAEAAQGKPKYYFRISNVECPANKKIVPVATEILEQEFANYPEFTTDVHGANTEEAQLAEIQRQGMKGYQVSMRITKATVTIKDPAPGKRDQQMSIDVKVSIFGHTIPGRKLMFTGDGDASLTGEFSERLKDKEEDRFMRTALTSAIKQALTTAVSKLTNATLEDRTGGKSGKKRKGKGKH
jgi:hypothetical protein